VPIALGNRFSPPFVVDALRPFAGGRVVALPTTPYGGPAAGGAYEAAVVAARAELGPEAPAVEMVGPYWDRSGFVAAVAEGLRATVDGVDEAAIAFTAHSVPVAAADDYRAQVEGASALVAGNAVPGRRYDVAWQSRSGRPADPWLEPDINDHLRSVAADGVRSVVVCPIGFVCDHMEVVNDLDVDAAATASELGLTMKRAPTAGTHPAFVDDLATLVSEQM
jgi:ferrochelatase